VYLVYLILEVSFQIKIAVVRFMAFIRERPEHAIEKLHSLIPLAT
jgi:hypothetical protein